jgi:RNA polymerase sigma-70 factor (ECF subfamily)
MSSTSSKLLEAVRNQGDEEAWARFVAQYAPLLLAWARRLGLRPGDAEDLVQDVFITLVQTMPTFTYERQKSFRGWLRTVALNKWRDRCRAGVRPAGVGRLSDLPAPDDAEALWEAEHNRYLVGRALEVMRAEFQPTTWKACWELVVNDRPAAEVARELDITENAVYIAKCRVLQRLRRALAGLLG